MCSCYYDFDTRKRNTKDRLEDYLVGHGFIYELFDRGGAGNPNWHFEILLSDNDVPVVNHYLNQIA